MTATKLIFTGLLVLVFSSAAFADHKHRPLPKNHHFHQAGHQLAKHKHAEHRAREHYIAHRESAGHYPYKQSYQLYPHRKVYRTVKHHPTYHTLSRDLHRYYHHHDRNYEHRLSYKDERRDTYRLIAGAIVLNEVLHHIHH